MSNQENTVAPTPLESAQYFATLPALDHQRRVIAPRAFILPDGPGSDVNSENLAEINTDQPAVIAFADNVNVENRDAIMLGVEFAEKVAGKKFDIDLDPINYLKSYVEAFGHAGWTMAGGGSEYGHESTSHKSVDMDAFVIEILASIAGPNAPAVLQLMKLTLEKLQGDKPMMKLFEANAVRGKKTSFRMIPCLQSAAGTPVTYLLAMDIESSTHSGGALFWKWKVSNLTVKRMAKGVQFTRSSFNRNEAAIHKYLGADADAFFEGLPR